MQQPGFKIDLIPPQGGHFTGTKTMPVRQYYQQSVTFCNTARHARDNLGQTSSIQDGLASRDGTDTGGETNPRPVATAAVRFRRASCRRPGNHPAHLALLQLLSN